MAKAVAEFEPVPAGLRSLYFEGECDEVIRPILQRPRADRGPVFAFLDSFGGPASR